ncbi:MAG: exodeoxyribonuclease VII small subunit [Candidatus Limivivens sp.]|nr:exodeoxyribonuclease VII small subunit [Candidatus Limivivens sp.]
MDEKRLEEMSLEEAFQYLEEIIARMESREITLEESFQKYQEGMILLKNCSEKIDRVEKKMLVLNENGEADEF